MCFLADWIFINYTIHNRNESPYLLNNELIVLLDILFVYFKLYYFLKHIIIVLQCSMFFMKLVLHFYLTVRLFFGGIVNISKRE